MTPSPHPRLTRVEVTPKTILLVILAIAAVWAGMKLIPALLVLVGALMIVGTLNPMAAWLEARHFGRKTALALVIVTVIGLTAILLYVSVPPLVNQVKHIAQREPELRARLIEVLHSSPMTRSLGDGLSDLDYGEVLKSAQPAVLSGTKRAIEIAAYLLATVFLGIYIMIDRNRLRGAVFAVVPRRLHLRFSHVLLSLQTIVGGYIRGQVITCALMTAFLFTVLTICHVPNALALAVFGGFMDVLPYIGPILTIGPAVIAAYSNGPAVAIVVFVALLLYEEFESRVLVPIVYGRSLRLPSSIVFFSLIVGGALAGIIGALLALPLAAAVVMLIEELRVDLPGEAEQPKAAEARQKDAQEEKVYERLTEKKPVQKAAAIAVKIAQERREEELEAKDPKSHRPMIKWKSRPVRHSKKP